MAAVTSIHTGTYCVVTYGVKTNHLSREHAAAPVSPWSIVRSYLLKRSSPPNKKKNNKMP